MTANNRHNDSAAMPYVDWWAILIWVALAAMGWLNIYAAGYNETDPAIFDISQRHGMQLVWIGVSAFVALAIMLIDVQYWHMWAYPLYIALLLILIAVLFVGVEVNGAKAWMSIAGVRIQPAEFMKFATALAVARYMSRYSFSIRNIVDLLKVAGLIALPVLIIIMQNDTGSAVVYGAFLFMLYREGLNAWIYVALIMLITLFFTSFLLTPITLLTGIILVCVIAEGLINRHWKSNVIYVSALALATIMVYFTANFLLDVKLSAYATLLACSLISLIFVGIYAYRKKRRNIDVIIALFLGSLIFTAGVEYVFDEVLQPHQQERILHTLGLESDLQGAGYNVNQSKIAIGSGGFLGKGFLEGTQTRFDFVPEQVTDFIFCTVGEEWGFVGSSIVVVLFCLLILRLMRMGERQGDPFGRVYCYSAAGIFFVHVVINIGMTTGIIPVIGIPLPFFSYGGSSFLAFTILYFIAVRMDSGKRSLEMH